MGKTSKVEIPNVRKYSANNKNAKHHRKFLTHPKSKVCEVSHLQKRITSQAKYTSTDP